MFSFPVGEMNSGAGGTETGKGEIDGKSGPDERDVGGRVGVIGGIEDVDVDDTGGGDVDTDDETVG